MKLIQMHQCAIAFRPEIAFWTEMTLRPKTILSNLKWLFGQKWQWIKMAFKSEIAFLLEIGFKPFMLVSNLIVAFWLQMPYFSKYWKVWLTFDGWKLSGLFFHILKQSSVCFFGKTIKVAENIILFGENCKNSISFFTVLLAK